MALGVNRLRALFVKTAFIGALASALLVLAVAHTRALEWLEAGTYDARVRWSADPNRADKSIVIIDVDDASFNGLKDKLGRWPWSRRVWSAFVYHLAQGRPRVIAFDSIFGGQESEATDQDFGSRIRQAGNVVLAYSLSDAVEIGFEGEDLNFDKLTLLERDSYPATARSIGERFDAKKTAYNVPLDVLAGAATGLGCVTSIPDLDGVNRRIALQYVIQGKVLRALSLRTTDLVNGKNGIFERAGRSAVRANDSLPVDSAGRMVILWHGGSTTYERIPAWKLVASIYPQQFPETRVYYPPQYFRDKIVLIGASAAGSLEARATPFSEVTPGFITHAAAIDNLLHNEAVHSVPTWFTAITIIGFALLGTSLVAAMSAGWMNLVCVLLSASAYWIAAYVALARFHLWLPVISPLAALGLSYGSASLIRFATTGRELRRTRNTLDRYVSPALVNYVLENIDNIKLDGERKELTIFFSDVRNFTTLTEGSEPMELIHLLDEYLHAMTEVIFKYDGIVDKFIGDGILAYWGAFTPGKNHALLAAQASLEMLVKLEELNQKWASEGRKTLRIGIGINTGNVVFGNVGRGRKMEFTVIGDPVNLASRLEGLNKDFGTSIIISEFTYNKLGENARVRPLGNVKVKGKTIETAVFELQGFGTGPETTDSLTVDAVTVEQNH
jgi:adenylate cyclase